MFPLRFILFVLFITPAFAIPKTIVFVSNPQAKVCANLEDSKNCKKLAIGQKLEYIRESGKFAEVVGEEGTGYVFRVYLSSAPPDFKLPSMEVKDLKQLNSRARASSYVETASARGLNDSQNGRIRGTKDEFDMESIRWLESITSSR